MLLHNHAKNLQINSAKNFKKKKDKNEKNNKKRGALDTMGESVNSGDFLGTAEDTLPVWEVEDAIKPDKKKGEAILQKGEEKKDVESIMKKKSMMESVAKRKMLSRNGQASRKIWEETIIPRKRVQKNGERIDKKSKRESERRRKKTMFSARRRRG